MRKAVECAPCAGGFPPLASIVRIFATNAALTNEINGVANPRSRFGPADSWVIKNPGAAVSAAGR
jgi:hypothetical protein